jgi:hypothetical protein
MQGIDVIPLGRSGEGLLAGDPIDLALSLLEPVMVIEIHEVHAPAIDVDGPQLKRCPDDRGRSPRRGTMGDMQVEVTEGALELVRKKGGTAAIDWIPKYG